MDVVKESKALFYSPPEAMDAEVDPLIRPICEAINKSGWVWTAESCQGHPDAAEGGPWRGNTSPMLRLITRKADQGRMLSALMEAYLGKGSLGEHAPGLFEVRGLRIYPSSRPAEGWTETLIYLDAGNVYQRNQALDVWNNFSTLINSQSAEK